MTETRELWRRQIGETPKAFKAFCHYRNMPAMERSVPKAYAIGSPNSPHRKDGNTHWKIWANKYNWLERAAAYDEHLYERDRLKWEARRQAVKERDYEQGEALRKLADQLLITSHDFIQENRQFIPGENGKPDKEIIRQAIDAPTMLKIIDLASKIQRLATGETTENQSITLAGEVLDRMIEKEMRKATQVALLDDPDVIDGELVLLEDFEPEDELGIEVSDVDEE